MPIEKPIERIVVNHRALEDLVMHRRTIAADLVGRRELDDLGQINEESAVIKVMLPRLRALPKLEVACEQDEPYAIPAFLDSESVLPEDRLGKGITIAIAAMGPQSRPSLFHEK